MGYYMDMSKVSLDEFRKALKKAYLLPSQKVLLDDIDGHFKTLRAHKMRTMEELGAALKTKKKVGEVSDETSIPVEYLTVLRRQVNSHRPQARKLRDFRDVSAKTKKKLEKLGLKTTYDLYDRVLTRAKRNRLQEELGASAEEILLLTRVTDLCRLRYVNHTFATLLVNTRYNTVAKISKVDPEVLHKELLELNKGNKYFKGNIGLNDIVFLVKDTGNIPLEIKY